MYMNNEFEARLKENLEADIASLEAEVKGEVDGLKKELDDFQKTRKDEIELELEAERAETLFEDSIHEDELKEEKKKKKKHKVSRKDKKKNAELHKKVEDLKKELTTINYKITNDEIIIETKLAELEHKKDELKSKADEMLNAFKENDKQKITLLTCTIMATKVKIENKVKIEDIELIEVDNKLTFDINFEPKLNESYNQLFSKEIKISNKDKFEITKKDNFLEKVEEITSKLGLVDETMFHDTLLKQMKKEKGAKFTKEFIAE